LAGYAPIHLNHDDVSTRQGYLLGNEYKVVSLPDNEGNEKLHLMGKAVLVSPEAKFNYLNGLYREVSPTIQSDYTISELSYVNVPAQLTNISLSANTEEVTQINENVVPSLADWESKIIAAKLAVIEEEQQNKIKQKETVAKYYTETLLKNGVIASSQRKKMENMFIQLSSGEESIVANALLAVGKSPLNHKPKNVLLKGALDMSKTKDERFAEFRKQHGHEYKNDQFKELSDAFEKYDAAQKIQLSTGIGEITDPILEVQNQLDALVKAGGLTDEHKKILAKYCGHEISLEASTNVGSGDPVDGGTEIGVPNNTSLGADNNELGAKTNLTQQLEDGYNAAKSEAASWKAKAEEAESKLTKIKNDLGIGG
jgi:hypothetical protein